MTQADVAARIAAQVSAIRGRIASVCRDVDRSPDSVTLVAVGKTFDAGTVRHGLAAGLTDFGENRVQEAQAKIPQVGGGRWHLVGHLQRNSAAHAPTRLSTSSGACGPGGTCRTRAGSTP